MLCNADSCRRGGGQGKATVRQVSSRTGGRSAGTARKSSRTGTHAMHALVPGPESGASENYPYEGCAKGESPCGLGPVEGIRAGTPAVQSASQAALLACLPPITSPPPSTRPFSPPLKAGFTPLHTAAVKGSAPVVALLLATPGVDPMAKSRVRGAQMWLRDLPYASLCCSLARLR